MNVNIGYIGYLLRDDGAKLIDVQNYKFILQICQIYLIPIFYIIIQHKIQNNKNN